VDAASCLRLGERGIDQRERFYVVRVHDTRLARDGWTATERWAMTDARWWSVDEIAASSEWFAPRRLAALLPPIVAGDYPPEPIDAG
jgi:hypothetical protein